MINKINELNNVLDEGIYICPILFLLYHMEYEI